MPELENQAHPRVIYGEKVSPDLTVDTDALADTMHELDISDETIENTTIYMDPSNRLATNGIAYPKTLGRLRHILHPELRRAPGPVVRVSAKIRGAEREEEDMNHTLSHELEHIAQIDRKDPRLKIGHLAIWGSAALGAVIGNKLGSSKKGRAAGTLLGAMVGQQIGYKIAPHEQQARERSKIVNTSAIKRTQHR
jgi:glycine zipper 2TM protein